MKKIVFLAAILLGAALFVGCSNSSDSPIPFIPSGGSKLPKSVGKNELKGKSFDKDGIYKLKFGEKEFVESEEPEIMESEYNTAYKLIEKYTYSYTYNSTTRQVFCLQKKAQRSVIRDGKETVIPEPKFSTDAEFIDGFEKALKIEYDLASSDDLNARAKGKRYSTFSQFGYRDFTCEQAVPDETIAEYNKYNNSQSVIDIHAYEFSDHDTFYFMKYDFRFPKGLTLKQIYNDYYSFLYSDNNGNGDWALFNTFGSSPEITTVPEENKGYRLSSITSSAIYTSQDAALSGDPALKWAYTPKEREFKYKVEDHSESNYVLYIVDELGTFEITCAAANNIPDPTTLSCIEYDIEQ